LDSLHIDFVATVVRRAFRGSRPEILDSDQGCQFTSRDYIDLLKRNGIEISMDGRAGRWITPSQNGSGEP